ncbi:hypothetical protein BRDCF_p1526 [Bacteroidales bacterium CF]|nr:hypothetical protein BRDCF_p1526 [Bacteroidales bacterium CF]
MVAIAIRSPEKCRTKRVGDRISGYGETHKGKFIDIKI